MDQVSLESCGQQGVSSIIPTLLSQEQEQIIDSKGYYFLLSFQQYRRHCRLPSELEETTGDWDLLIRHDVMAAAFEQYVVALYEYSPDGDSPGALHM